MLDIGVSLVLVIILFIALGVTRDGYGSFEGFKLNRKQVFAALGLIPMLFACFTMVPANSVGIQYNPFAGGTQEETLGEGFMLKSPLTKIYVISTEVQTKTIEGLSVQTKDSQFVKFNIDIKYQVATENASEVFKQFRTLSRIDESLVVPVAQKAIENVATQYNVMEVLGEKRSEIYSKVEKELATQLEKNGIKLMNIVFVDTDAGEEIEASIRKEAAAKKEVDIAEQAKLKAEIDAQSAVVKAQADKQTAILAAEAEAETIRIKQEQLAKNKDYVDLILAEAWNGELPTYYFGGGNGDLPSLILQGMGDK